MKEMASKPIKLRNLSSGHEFHDTLHNKTQNPGVCNPNVCLGSTMFPHMAMNTDPRSKDEVRKGAKEFIDEYYQSIKRFPSDQHSQRWVQVSQEIEAKGHYELTQTELVYGTKLAWRNAPRCIGRIQWSKLQMFDARSVTSASGMFEAICKHIKYATNKGLIRSAITIFPQRTDGKHDYRVWNAQLINYAGYKNPDGTITGDPAKLNVEFTEICQKLGWKGKGGRFDPLPLVLSADGQDPEWFDIPEDLILEVPISHPEYKNMVKLGIRWFVMPAVSSMCFDVGGLQFPATPFNGWYMASEIATRNFCDPYRYNFTEQVGKVMGLDTSSQINLWKDKVMLELNIAVLYSFQKLNVTIMDHHTASESFIKHYETEQRLRGGCPADWVWVVPPISGSLTEVFHLEMSLYYLKPSYEYQTPAWKTHVWKKNRDGTRTGLARRTKKKFRFKEIARAVKFTSNLFGKALSKRIKATILYATETGKSENYAKKLGEIFGYTFNAQVICMCDYDIINIEHEAVVIVVTSTFGNGDPPENGEDFAKNLYSMKVNGTAAEATSKKLHRSLSFIKQKSITDLLGKRSPTKQEISTTPLYIRKPLGSTNSHGLDEPAIGPLSNLRYAVFALGSSAYPNFCAFGKYVDNLLGELGGERLVSLTCGDELAGQETQFNQWAADVFTHGCESFCLDDEAAIRQATKSLKTVSSTYREKFRMKIVEKETDLEIGLSKAHSKKVRQCDVIQSRNLHGEKARFVDTNRWTQQIMMGSFQDYQPGDHVAVLPANRAQLVDVILKRLVELDDPEQPVEIMVLKETHTPNGLVSSWEPHTRLPNASVRTLLTRYFDITTPPTPNFLHLLAEHTADVGQKTKLEHLATDPEDYEEWKHQKFPNLPEVLEEYPAIKLDPSLLFSQLPLLQPRFYSISSSPLVHPKQIHLTVAVVLYNTQGGKGPLHYGVCSNYLKDVQPNDIIHCFVRRASSFHLPKDPTRPVILVGPGTGIAPFRGFWQHRKYLRDEEKKKVGDMSLFFGCRTRALDLYRDEKDAMLEDGILANTYLALSREPSIPKTYVQDVLVKVGSLVYKQMVEGGGHFYVCGDCTMAECVYQRLRSIIQQHGNMSDEDVEAFMLKMRDENRYHEDIFGITLRTEEIHSKTRESTKSRLSFISKSGSSAALEAALQTLPKPTNPPTIETKE